MYAYVHITPSSNISINDLVKVLIETRSYVSIILDELNYKLIDLYVTLLKELVKHEFWSEARRIGLLFGKPIQSPYYPISINLSGSLGLSLALLYPHIIQDVDKSNLEVKVEEICTSAEKLALE